MSQLVTVYPHSRSRQQWMLVVKLLSPLSLPREWCHPHLGRGLLPQVTERPERSWGKREDAIRIHCMFKKFITTFRRKENLSQVWLL